MIATAGFSILGCFFRPRWLVGLTQNLKQAFQARRDRQRQRLEEELMVIQATIGCINTENAYLQTLDCDCESAARAFQRNQDLRPRLSARRGVIRRELERL
jgi:hypothetical protein